MLLKSLFIKECRSNFKILLIFMAIVSMYASMIVAMFDPKLGKSLEMMSASMPELFAAFGMTTTGATLIDFVANYLYGFILIAIPSIFTIIITNRLIARYVDRGSMAYLLATPHKRSSIIFTQFIVMQVALLILVVYATILIYVCANIMFSSGIDLQKLVVLNIGLYAMLTFFGGVCFLSSCLFNETKWSIGVGAGVIIFSILIQMLSQIGNAMDYLKYMTPLTLFDAKEIITMDASAIMNFIIMFVVGLIFSFIGMRIFTKKDLSL